jgi:hypothetical protein
MAVGEQFAVADANEDILQDVHQETPQQFHARRVTTNAAA